MDGSAPTTAEPVAKHDAVVPTEDVLSREEQRRQPLYAGHVKVYPKDVKGQVRKVKWLVLAACLTLYYLAPWLRWDRGPGAPDQALLVDMPNRRAYFFWIEIWPQEVYYLTGLLILGALGLFLATSIGGRVWCGFTCPQTVWTDLFMWVERKIEGDRGARIRLDSTPMTAAKLNKKLLKHAVWLLISLATGGAWIMYFNDAPTVIVELFTGQSSLTVYFFVGLFSATTYLLAGMAREQVCTYMCPWPRFQAALLDEDSLVVTYQGWRGEPRAPHKKGDPWEGRGDCIDCKQCVAVCPTGIDIRDGLQLECIGCGLCIDACNDVMDRVERPRDLISFDTDRNRLRRAADEQPVKPHIFRLRTIVYLVVISLVGLIMLAALSFRSSLDVNVLHDRNPLFITLSDGAIRNGYTVKVLNKVREPRSYSLAVEGLENASLSVVGQETADAEAIRLEAEPDSVASYRVYISMPRDDIPEPATPFTFVLTEHESGDVARPDSVFRGPLR
ncbi:MAG: cytochrome c oxidase accessory protein CcoG [Kiloniellales bacterium]|nr:cytochrome c oxidase accessory protein CcoG [Kiloniellales bacterium]